METRHPLNPPPEAARLPGLDGLRAVAVLLVVFHHLCSQGTFASLPVLARVLKQGSFGVQIFFVLSGFLITWLLLREERRTGTTDIGRFYFRRSLRILPPAFFYLAVMLLLTAVGVVAVGRRDFIYSFFFVRNAYGIGGSPEVAHYWSLAVEEQFYLTWPFVFLFTKPRIRLTLTAALAVLLAVWRAAGLVHFGVTAAGAEALLLGCLLAQVRQQFPGLLVAHSAHTRALVVAGACGVIGAVVFGGSPTLESSGVAQSLAVLAVGAIVNAVAEGKVTVVSAVLDAPAVQWIGRLSYSLYLWQQVFCWGALSGLYAASAWPLLVGASFAAAAVSYYGVERPALAFRERLELRLYPRHDSAGIGSPRSVAIS